MVAYTMHLLRISRASEVRIHPDGEHGKRFNFRTWLESKGFEKISTIGATPYGGVYRNDHDQTKLLFVGAVRALDLAIELR